ncbi:vWA domain-containing protein [Liberibacter crescens]|uniref:vWA domain-containing protein n=1 Tax=Liberibacter crescens TaxID=1273132 RepID=UPI0007630B1D|nr:TadE/TadG family type IV pilus assembly protein [Liberibacter crescens]AMC12852.1 hypothetical protein RL73_04020 [Liberibacter crescens]
MIYFKNKILLLRDTLWSMRGILRDCSGNFALITALILPVLFAAVGLGIDVSHLFLTRSSLQAAADNAVITAASKLSVKDPRDKDPEKTITTMVRENLKHRLTNFLPEDVSTAIANETPIEIKKLSSHPTLYQIYAAPEYDMPLCPFSVVSLLAGRDNMKVCVEGITIAQQEEIAPVSIELVLDVSYSMIGRIYNHKKLEYRTKIDALQEAVVRMMQTLSAKGFSDDLLRVGITTFSGRLEKVSPLAWGTTTADTFMRNLKTARPEDGTNSTHAIRKAYKALTARKEDKQHTSKNHQSFKKYIIFMTDGMNFSEKNDAETLKICNKAKKEGIEIFTISIGLPDDNPDTPYKMSRKRVQNLMNACASSPRNYYDAEEIDPFIEIFQTIVRRIADQEVLLIR